MTNAFIKMRTLTPRIDSHPNQDPTPMRATGKDKNCFPTKKGQEIFCRKNKI